MVPRNAQQKCVDRAASLVVITCFTHQQHKNFMSYVFGYFSCATHLQGKAVNIRLSPTVKLGKRFAVAANDQLQKVAVRGLNRFHQTWNCSAQDVFTGQTEKVPKDLRITAWQGEMSWSITVKVEQARLCGEGYYVAD